MQNKARPIAVPFALKPAIERGLEAAGIIQKVAHSLWAAPVVSVPKGGGPGGQIRLCGDYKVTIYPELENDQYLLPKPEELFRKLAGGKRFLKIDLTYAYQEMSLEESSHHKHTQRGVPNHTVTFWDGLHFSIVSASNGQFFRGSMRVFATLILAGSSVEEHLQNLENILKRILHWLQEN